MSAIVRVPREDWVRRTGDAYETVPPEGKRSSIILRAARPVLVELRCPGCRRFETIAEPLHRVGSDGLVLPAIVCMVPGCGFDGLVALVDWDPDTTAVDLFPGLRFGAGGLPP